LLFRNPLKGKGDGRATLRVGTRNVPSLHRHRPCHSRREHLPLWGYHRSTPRGAAFRVDRPPTRVLGLVVQADEAHLILSRVPRKGESITPPRSSDGNHGSDLTCNTAFWTREPRNGSFNRTISGQSVVSAVISALPEGVHVPSFRRGINPGAPSVRSASHREVFASSHTVGDTEREDSRISPDRGHRSEVSGAAAAGDGSRTDPVPCGTTRSLRGAEPPPTEAGSPGGR